MCPALAGGFFTHLGNPDWGFLKIALNAVGKTIWGGGILKKKQKDQMSYSITQLENDCGFD